MYKHTGVKRHQCKDCGEAFVYNKQLRAHRVIHTGVPIVKPTFKCDLCDKTFAYKYSLKDHRNLHTGETPYKCELCSASFTHAKFLRDHNKKYHADNGFISVSNAN